MEQGISATEAAINCVCGASLVTGEQEAAQECQVCGRPVGLPEVGAKEISAAGAPPPAAPEDDANPLSKQMRKAAGFVNAKRYLEALGIYKYVLQEDFEHRDAMYGLGFCNYKLGYFGRSRWMLERAHELGHPSAQRLVRKIDLRLEERQQRRDEQKRQAEQRVLEEQRQIEEQKRQQQELLRKQEELVAASHRKETRQPPSEAPQQEQ